jgi:hypothetical protein
VIACSLPPLIDMHVSYDEGLKLMINDDDYYYGDVYFIVMIVYLNVLDSGYNLYSCIINMDKILKARMYLVVASI